MPDVPTIAEAGVPGYEAAVWYGLLAPANVPAPTVAKLHRDVSAGLNLPDVREVLTHVMADVTPSPTQKAFGEFLAREAAKWTKVVKASGAKEEYKASTAARGGGQHIASPVGAMAAGAGRSIIGAPACV